MAGEVLLSYFGSSTLRTSEKAYLDVVTQADTECEQLVVGELKKSFPEDAIVGEEGARTESGSGRVWFVDPLDGTFNFSRTLPFWCISIGMAVEGQPQVGVVFDPLHDELFAAVRGTGGWLNGNRIGASSVENQIDATLQLTVNYDREVIERSIADINAVARNVMRIRNMGALALELCYVGAGRLDAVAQRGSHPWDYAAGILVAEEGGATVSNLDGTGFDLFTDDALVAATSQLHASLASAIKGQPNN